MQEVDDPLGGHKHPTNTDITNSSIWVKADEYTGSLDDVHAIAVDARYMQDGTEFILQPEQVITLYINMRAPRGEEADEYIQNDAHAYNNIYLDCISVDSITGGEGEKLFIRQDYVKVGLVENHLTVKKVWDDDDNRDGIRPDNITITLYRNNEPYLGDPEVPNPVTIEMDEEGKIEYTFKYLPYCDDEGVVFHYSIVEDEIEGYRSYFTRPETSHEITITNKHETEKIDITGEKIWVDDEEEFRPTMIKVNLYADGELFNSTNVFADAQGNWKYTFNNLNKYRDGGKEIVYTVDEEEIINGSLNNYIIEVNDTNITNTYYPFGDARLTKNVENSTGALQDIEYPFSITILDKEDKPIFDSFKYDVVNKEGQTIRSGNVTTGDNISLKEDETIVIKEIPSSSRLVAKENIPDGFKLKGSEEKNVEISTNGDNQLTFVNVYSTSGYVNLKANKKLENSQIRNYQFRFDLTDEEGNVIQRVSNRHDGSVYFGAIYYDAKDDGKTFTYYIKEEKRDKPGFIYDDSECRVEVKVVDNGNGTMTATPTYYLNDELVDGIPEFVNKYEAEGDLSLKVWKQLSGRDLENGEFTFEVLDQEDEVLLTSTNDADGNVVFEDIHFNQDDIGKEFIYKIREKAGDDETVVYSEEFYTVKVVVADNGDGTLSFNQEVTDKDNQTATPIFKNELEPGRFAIEKIVEDNTPGEFKFKVKLTGENIPEDGSYEYTKEQINNGNTGYTNNIFDNLLTLLTPHKIYADEGDIDSGVFNGMSWRITSDWQLILGEEGQTQTLNGTGGGWPWRSVGNEYDKNILSVKFAGPVNAKGDLAYMFSTLEKATSIDLEGINTSEATGMSCMFWRDASLTSLDVSMLDVTNCNVGGSYPSLYSMFSECPNLESITGLDNWDTSNVTNMGSMFRGDESLTFIDVSKFNTENCTSFASMFSRCKKLETIDVSNFKTANATSMSAMFYMCESLKSIDVSKFNTSNVEEMYMMFGYCSSLTEINVSNFNTENVERFGLSGSDDGMFSHCTSLKELDLHNFKTSNVYDFDAMFQGCTNLEYLDISGFDTNNASDFSNVFRNCPALREVVLSKDMTNWPSSGALPNPPTPMTTGKWKYKNGGIDSKTASDLCTEYPDNATNWKGNWIWEESEFDIIYVSDKDDQIVDYTEHKTYSELLEYSILSNDDPSFIGWNPTAYDIENEQLDLNDYTKSSGGYTLAYKHDGSTIAKPSESLVDAYVTKPEDATVKSALDFLLRNIPEGKAIAFYGVYSTSYEVKYEPGTGASGSMAQAEVKITDSYTIKDSEFYYFNHHQTGWSGSDGNTYDLNQEIPANTFTGGTVLTLTAIWEADDNSVQMKDGEFEVILNSNERATFDNIPAGTAYQVWEETPSGWVLIQSVNTSGEIEPLETSTAKFTNEYNPEKTSAQFTVKKTLDGKNAKENEFEFELLDNEENVIQTKKNSSGGGITFDIITYSAIGTYTYTIKEKAGTDNNIVYDDKDIKVKVVVSKDSSGNLIAEVSYTPEEALFENTTKPGGLKISKTVEGTDATDKEFTFTVTFSDGGSYEYGGSKQGTISSGGTITLKADESITISGLPAGCTYTVEESAIPDGYTLTELVNSEGKIESQVTAEATFTNTYSAVGSINLEAVKKLKNGTLNNGQFTFNLLDENDTVIDVTSNNASGKVVFDLIEYDQAGTYTYKIVEVEGDDENIIYDDTVQEVIVTVTDLGNGKLEAVANYDEESIPEFENEMKGKDLVIKKLVDGATAAAAEKEFVFTVVLNDAEGNQITEEHDYTTSKGNSGKVASNGQLKLTADEEVTIANLPIGSTYEIIEGTVNGFRLTSKNNETGEVLITGANAEFTNTYSSYGEVNFEINKVLEGRKLTDKQFMFALSDSNGNILLYGYNDENGLVKFPTIGYTHTDDGKTYKYSISEVNPEDPGYTYSDETINVTVIVSDTGNGTITFSVSYDDEAKTLVNKYDSYGEIELLAHKNLTGRKIEEGLFKFELVDENGEVVSTGTNDANGDVIFDKLSFTEEDADTSYTYTIREVNEEKPGYTYDQHEETVVVKIEDPGYGILKITAEYDEDEAVFENEYKAEGEYAIKATKELLGSELKDKQFKFELKDSEGNVLETVENDADGNIVFSPIKFNQDDIDKKYKYTISEIVPETKAPGYTYSEKDVEVEITVVDNGDGTLNFATNYSEKGIITNIYEAKGELVLKAKKQIVGKLLTENEFTFRVLDEQGNIKATGKNNANGEIVFEPIVFSEKDSNKTYKYSIVEVDLGKPGITYDHHKEYVTIMITDNGDGTLKVVEQYEGKTTFNNIYEPPVYHLPKTGD